MNLTITVDEEILRRARLRALERGTSVNAILREVLVSFAGGDDERAARSRLAALARASTASSGSSGRSWAREDLYAERLDRLAGAPKRS